MSLRMSFAVVVAVAAGIATSTCSSPSAPTPMPVDIIAGAWTLVAQQPAGQPEAAPPAGATFSFQITNGRASVNADCNRCSGPTTLTGGTVIFGPPLACTRAYCARSAPFDTTFVSLLSTDNTIALQGGTLTLASERGVLRFRRD